MRKSVFAWFLILLVAGASFVTAQDPVSGKGPGGGESPKAAAVQKEEAEPAPAPAGNEAGVARNAVAETANAGQQMKLFEFLKLGGILMFPLAGLSFVAVLLIVYYLFTIRQGTVVSDRFMNTAEALIRKQDYLGLIAVCNRENEAIARITCKTLEFATKNPTASFEEVRDVTEAEGSRQASSLSQRINYLADVGSVAPMLGLLGTVMGLIKTFGHLNSVQANPQGLMGEGVSEALIATAAGLIIGIPSLMFYSFFRGRVQKMISEMEAATTHLMGLLAAQYKLRGPARTALRSEEGEPAGGSPVQTPDRRKEGGI